MSNSTLTERRSLEMVSRLLAVIDQQDADGINDEIVLHMTARARTLLACNRVQRCRVCGCTHNDACENGCAWAARDLCTKCLPRAASFDAALLRSQAARIAEGRYAT